MEYLYFILKIALFYIIISFIINFLDKNNLNKLNIIDIFFLFIIFYFILYTLKGDISIFYSIFLITIYLITERLKNKKVFSFIKNDKNDNLVENNIPLAIIMDGDIDYEALNTLQKDKKWLESNLDCDVEEIYYAFFNKNKLYIIKKRDFIKLQ